MDVISGDNAPWRTMKSGCFLAKRYGLGGRILASARKVSSFYPRDRSAGMKMVFDRLFDFVPESLSREIAFAFHIRSSSRRYLPLIPRRSGIEIGIFTIPVLRLRWNAYTLNTRVSL